jgi:hypothetical protein
MQQQENQMKSLQTFTPTHTVTLLYGCGPIQRSTVQVQVTKTLMITKNGTKWRKSDGYRVGTSDGAGIIFETKALVDSLLAL